MYTAITILSAIVFTSICLIIFNKKSNRSFGIFLKAIVVIFCGVGFFRLMLSDTFILVSQGVWIENGKEYNAWLQIFLRWGYYLNYAVLPMAVFFNSRLFKNISCYVCLPFSILSAVFFKDYMPYFLSLMGEGLHPAVWFRYAYFSFELALAISIPLLFQIKERYYFNYKDKRELLRFMALLPIIVLTMMPVYVPKALFGNPLPIPVSYKIEHILWIVSMLIIVLTLYYLFRFRSYKDRYMLCVFLTIVLFFHYDSLYLKGFTLKRLPVQLCNIASYFYLIAIPFRLKKMFNFCFLANITGALIAIFVPDFQTGLLDFWTVHYILEHTLVLIIPALCMGLRIFPRLEVKSLFHLWVGYTLYFLFVFILGTILNGHIKSSLEKVNYFYMFNLDFALGKAPFLTFTKHFVWNFGPYVVYPLIVSIIYVGFYILCVCFYFAVKYLYKIEDDHLKLRLSSIALYEEITGKTSKRPKSYVD